MSRTARAFWTIQEGKGELRAETLPAVSANQVLVRTVFSAISRGTELLVFHGRVPASQFESMRAPFQEGHFAFPVKYGYASVGRVEEGTEELQGRTVFCLYPHQTAYVVPASAVVALPAGIPPERAVLAANLETALNGLWDAAPLAGDRIGVIGAGTVGCLFAYLVARMPGTEVTVIDVDPRKAAIARSLGALFALPDDAPTDLDCVVEASGNPDALRRAMELAADEATIVELGWFGDRAVTLPLGEAFFSKRLKLIASQVGTVSPNKRRYSRRMRLELAVTLLADARLDALITAEHGFEELPELMRRLSSPEFFGLCERIRYD